jgi:AcrR family transcriptional regulator
MPDPFQFEFSAHDVPQTKRGHERCVALLESATELFLSRGYDDVSLDDIVNHAGGSKASIYKYFGSKEGLFKSICDYRRIQFFEDISITCDQKSDNLRVNLINTLINFYIHIKKPENARFVRLIMEQGQRNPEIARHIHESGPILIQKVIANSLEEAHKQGLLYCENPIYSAQLYFGILRNLEWRLVMGVPFDENDQDIINYISYAVDRFLDGHQKV